MPQLAAVRQSLPSEHGSHAAEVPPPRMRSVTRQFTRDAFAPAPSLTPPSLSSDDDCRDYFAQGGERQRGEGEERKRKRDPVAAKREVSALEFRVRNDPLSPPRPPPPQAAAVPFPAAKKASLNGEAAKRRAASRRNDSYQRATSATKAHPKQNVEFLFGIPVSVAAAASAAAGGDGSKGVARRLRSRSSKEANRDTSICPAKGIPPSTTTTATGSSARRGVGGPRPQKSKTAVSAQRRETRSNSSSGSNGKRTPCRRRGCRFSSFPSFVGTSASLSPARQLFATQRELSELAEGVIAAHLQARQQAQQQRWQATRSPPSPSPSTPAVTGDESSACGDQRGGGAPSPSLSLSHLPSPSLSSVSPSLSPSPLSLHGSLVHSQRRHRAHKCKLARPRQYVSELEKRLQIIYDRTVKSQVSTDGGMAASERVAVTTAAGARRGLSPSPSRGVTATAQSDSAFVSSLSPYASTRRGEHHTNDRKGTSQRKAAHDGGDSLTPEASRKASFSLLSWTERAASLITSPSPTQQPQQRTTASTPPAAGARKQSASRMLSPSARSPPAMRVVRKKMQLEDSFFHRPPPPPAEPPHPLAERYVSLLSLIATVRQSLGHVQEQQKAMDAQKQRFAKELKDIFAAEGKREESIVRGGKENDGDNVVGDGVVLLTPSSHLSDALEEVSPIRSVCRCLQDDANDEADHSNGANMQRTSDGKTLLSALDQEKGAEGRLGDTGSALSSTYCVESERKGGALLDEGLSSVFHMLMQQPLTDHDVHTAIDTARGVIIDAARCKYNKYQESASAVTSRNAGAAGAESGAKEQDGTGKSSSTPSTDLNLSMSGRTAKGMETEPPAGTLTAVKDANTTTANGLSDPVQRRQQLHKQEETYFFQRLLLSLPDVLASAESSRIPAVGHGFSGVGSEDVKVILSKHIPADIIGKVRRRGERESVAAASAFAASTATVTATGAARGGGVTPARRSTLGVSGCDNAGAFNTFFDLTADDIMNGAMADDGFREERRRRQRQQQQRRRSTQTGGPTPRQSVAGREECSPDDGCASNGSPQEDEPSHCFPRSKRHSRWREGGDWCEPYVRNGPPLTPADTFASALENEAFMAAIVQLYEVREIQRDKQRRKAKEELQATLDAEYAATVKEVEARVRATQTATMLAQERAELKKQIELLTIRNASLLERSLLLGQLIAEEEAAGRRVAVVLEVNEAIHATVKDATTAAAVMVNDGRRHIDAAKLDSDAAVETASVLDVHTACPAAVRNAGDDDEVSLYRAALDQYERQHQRNHQPPSYENEGEDVDGSASHVSGDVTTQPAVGRAFGAYLARQRAARRAKMLATASERGALQQQQQKGKTSTAVEPRKPSRPASSPSTAVRAAVGSRRSAYNDKSSRTATFADCAQQLKQSRPHSAQPPPTKVADRLCKQQHQGRWVHLLPPSAGLEPPHRPPPTPWDRVKRSEKLAAALAPPQSFRFRSGLYNTTTATTPSSAASASGGGGGGGSRRTLSSARKPKEVNGLIARYTHQL